MFNRHFSLRAEACNLNDVEDFANDESIPFFSLEGQFAFLIQSEGDQKE